MQAAILLQCHLVPWDFHVFKSRFLFFLSSVKEISSLSLLSTFSRSLMNMPDITDLSDDRPRRDSTCYLPLKYLTGYSYPSHQFQGGSFLSSCYSSASLGSSDWGDYQKLSENLSTPYQPNHPNPHACQCFRQTAADFSKTHFLLTKATLTSFQSPFYRLVSSCHFSFCGPLVD